MFDFLFPKRKIVTLDLGSRFIKAAGFELSGKQIIMTHFEMAPTPFEAVENGSLRDGQMIQNELELILFDKMKIKKNQKTLLSIGGKSIITRKIEIPKSELKITQEHVRWEASQYLPYNIEDANYGYIELPFLSEDSAMRSIFLVAIDKNTVNTYMMCLNALPVNVDAIEASLFARQRVLSASRPSPPLKPEENILILDLGWKITGFTVIRSGHVIFSRDLFTGSASYESAIQREMAVEPHEAQSFISAMCKEQAVPSEAVSIVKNHHPHFCREALMGLEFFLNYFPEDKISKCYLIGGGSVLPGLKAALAERMNIQTSFLAFLRGVQTRGFSKKRLKEIQPFASVCVGIALRLV